MQCEIEEVARSAGGIEHLEFPQPFKKFVQEPFRPVTVSCPSRLRLGLLPPFHKSCDLGLRRLPLGEPGTDYHGLDDPHDFVAVGVVRAELRAFVRVEAALEEGAQDRGVDLRPVERRRLERRLDLRLIQVQGSIVVEQPTVEPLHRLEPDATSGGHRPEQVPGHIGEFLRLLPRLSQHPGEHVTRQQAHVFGEHAEDQTVDENAPPPAGRGLAPATTAPTKRRSPPRAL